MNLKRDVVILVIFSFFKMTEKTQKTQIPIKFHKSLDGYYAKLTIPEDVIESDSKGKQPSTYIILDRSGSMGSEVAKLINIIIPTSLRGLGYTDEDIITLITFDSVDSSQILSITIPEMEKSTIKSRGTTYFKPALVNLLTMVKQSMDTRLRILTISDGAMHDIGNATEYSSKIAKILTQNRQINSQAVRYYTSRYGEPDTRGISCVLQLNTLDKPKLLDLYAGNMDILDISEHFKDLFKDDGFANNIEMTTTSNVLSNDPWKTPTNRLQLTSGENTIWFSEMPSEIDINGLINVEIVPEKSTDVDATNATEIISQRYQYYTNRIRILKVLNTDESRQEIQEILNYFQRFQTYLNSMSMVQNENYSPSLKYRLKTLKRHINQKQKSLYMKLQQIANDDAVSKMNAAQQADYLRKVDVSHNSKALAKRGEKTGFELSNIVYQEVRQMHQNVSQIKDIDDSTHKTSFYSTGTTLEGILTVCELVEDGILEDTDINQIIQLLNIVGVACYSNIGDYPDAMTYRVLEMFHGTYTSLSDITIVQSMGSNMEPPGQPGKEINNVIPIFDDERILKFFRKYAPTLLNLTAGVGMRRLMVDVPSTHMYTVCAGLWKCLSDLRINRSEVVIETTQLLRSNYNVTCGKYFQHIEPYLVDQPGNTSYFINNNGLTNMICLVDRMIRNKDTNNISRIMRAIYCYETYQLFKKILKRQENPVKYIDTVLPKLLNLDYQKYGTKVGEIFTDTPKPNHDLTFNVNDAVFTELTQSYHYIADAFMLPVIMKSLMEEDYVKAVRDLPEFTDEFICSVLDVPFTLKQFYVYSLVQSILYHDKQSRCDETKSKMIITDIGLEGEGIKIIQNYINNYYQKEYNRQIQLKKDNEKVEILKQLLNYCVGCNTASFEAMMKNGYEYQQKVLKISDVSSYGFIEVGQTLLNEDLDIEDRFQKLEIYILGKNREDEVVWNKGNCLRTSMAPYESIFVNYGQEELWERIKEKYRASVKHVYRGGEESANRHTHSNDKISYYGYGYKTMNHMAEEIGKEGMREYNEIHSICCGNGELSNYQRRKQERNKDNTSSTST